MTRTLPDPFWRADAPLILASRSEGRRLALAQTRLPVEVVSADVDERGIESRLGGADPDRIASTLARAKALAVSRQNPGRLVVGADQVASCDGRIFGKPSSIAQAREMLRFLSGRRHRLHSAVALLRDARVLFETVAYADLTMRPLSEDFIGAYLDEIGDTALTSAGAYQIEGLGAQLFVGIDGDHWTIMGLPLLALLDALRREGALLS